MKNNLYNLGIKARTANKFSIDTKTKNKVLNKYSQLIKKNKELIIKENIKDIKFAYKKNIKKNLIDRLKLNKKKLENICLSIKKISKLKDPVNIILDKWKRPNGLVIEKVTIPIGVIGIISAKVDTIALGRISSFGVTYQICLKELLMDSIPLLLS